MRSLLLLLTVAAVARAEPGITDHDIMLGACTALSGANQGVSRDQLAGAKAYIEYINHEQNGIYGRKIRLMVEDDAFDPERAIECFKNLVNNQAFAMAFVNGTPTGAKYIHMSELNHLPIVGFNSGAQFIFDPPKIYSFSVRSSYDDEATALIGQLWKETGVRRFAMIYEEDAFGASGLNSARKALKKFDADLVAVASILRDNPKIDDPIRQIRGTNPEAVILVSIPPIEAEVLKRSREEGWHPIFATISGKNDLLTKAGPAAEGTILMEPVPSPTDTSLAGVALFNRLLKRYETEAQPTFIGLVSFTEARVIVEALRRTGKDPTRDKFVAALESIDNMDVGLGNDFKVRFGKERHVAFDSVYATIAHDGKLTPLKDWKQLKP